MQTHDSSGCCGLFAAPSMSKEVVHVFGQVVKTWKLLKLLRKYPAVISWFDGFNFPISQIVE
jgi:hypothetical protein